MELVRDAVGDLEQLARFGRELTPEKLRALRALGAKAEELHLLALLSRLAGYVSRVL